MTLATVTRTSLAAILPVLRARLVSKTGRPQERVLQVQRQDPAFDGHGDDYIYVRIEDGDFDDANVIGAGRIDAREILPFAVVVRTRKYLDEANNDYVWVTDHDALRLSVHDAMICFTPTDADGNHLTTEPIKPDNSRRPRKDEGRDRRNKEWGQSELRYRMTYMLNLDQTEQ